MVVIRETEVVINPVDNVTAAINKLFGFLGRLDGGAIKLDIDDKVFDRLADVRENIAALGENVAIDVSLTDSTGDGAEDIEKTADKAAQSVNNVATASKKVGDEMDNTKKKGEGLFSTLEKSSNNMSQSLGGIKEQFAAMAITGAIGGFSWLKAKDSIEYQKEVMANIENLNGKKEGDSARKFVGEADSRYTSGGQRTELLRMVETTKARGDQANAAVSGMEKLAFSSETAQQKGYDAQSLMSLATRKGSLSGLKGTTKADIQAIFSSVPGAEELGKKFLRGGQATRMRILAEFDKKINIEDAIKGNPEKVLQSKLEAMSKSIGKTMIGPMNALLNAVNPVVDAFARFPIFSQGAGILLMAATAGMGMKLLFDAAGMAKEGMFSMLRVMGLTKTAEGELVLVHKLRTAAMYVSNAATWAATAARTALFGATEAEITAQVMATGAMEGDFVATEINTVAKNQGALARIRLTASTYASAIAEKMHTAASMIGSAVTWGRVAAMGAATTALAIGTGAASASTAIMGGLAAVETLAAGGAWALAAGVWAALSPLLPFIAAGAAIVGVLGLLAAKAGVLQPLLKGFEKINLGKVGKDLGKGDFGKAWHDLTKGFKFPSLSKMWDNLTSLPDFGKLIKLPSLSDITKGFKLPDLDKMLSVGLTAIFPVALLAKPLEKMIGFVSRLLDSSGIIQDLLSSGKELWKTLVDFLSGLWNTVQGMISWLRDGLGVTKAEKKAKYEQVSADTGYTWKESMGDHPAGWYKDGTRVVDDRTVPSTVIKAKEAMDKAPSGVFDDIGQKIYDALKSVLFELPSMIAAAITGAIDSVFGEGTTEGIITAIEKGFDTAKTTFDNILSAFQKIPWIGTFFGGDDSGDDNEPPTQTTPPTATSSTPAGAMPTQTPPITSPSSQPSTTPTRYKNIDPTIKSTISRSDWESYGAADKARWIPAYAQGATFNKGGLFTGKVHEKEEIIPQAVAQRGTGPISRVLGDLQTAGRGGGSATGRGSTTVHVAGSTYQINNPVVPDSGAAYQLTDILKRQLEPFIEERMKRMVAQYIT
jgi:hypothetical protein